MSHSKKKKFNAIICYVTWTQVWVYNTEGNLHAYVQVFSEISLPFRRPLEGHIFILLSNTSVGLCTLEKKNELIITKKWHWQLSVVNFELLWRYETFKFSDLHYIFRNPTDHWGTRVKCSWIEQSKNEGGRSGLNNIDGRETTHFSLEGSLRSTSGAIHSG